MPQGMPRQPGMEGEMPIHMPGQGGPQYPNATPQQEIESRLTFAFYEIAMVVFVVAFILNCLYGKSTNEGSNFLIMMIMGGGIVSWLQGMVADAVNIHFSYIVGVLCFAYLAFYAWRVSGILRKQGISFDTPIEGGH